MSQPFLGQIQPLGFGFAPRTGRYAMARPCRSRRAPRCFRCSAPCMAATAPAPSSCPICKAACRCISAPRRPATVMCKVRWPAKKTSCCTINSMPMHNHGLLVPRQMPAAPRTEPLARPLAKVAIAKRDAGQLLRPRHDPPAAQPGSLSPAGGNLPHTYISTLPGHQFLHRVVAAFSVARLSTARKQQRSISDG